jgi:hypothetical protein
MENCLNIIVNSPRRSFIFLSIRTLRRFARLHPQHDQHEACHPLSPSACAGIKAFGGRKRAVPLASARQKLRRAPFMVETAARPICISAMVLPHFSPGAIGGRGNGGLSLLI